MWTQSLTPASSTLWLPTGRPAFVSLSTARETSGVISLGWLKWRLIQSGWYFSSIAQSSSSIRWGRNTGTREPIRMISTKGILAQATQDRLAEFRGEREAVAAADEHVVDLRGRGRWSSWASCSLRLNFLVGSPTTGDRVQ